MKGIRRPRIKLTKGLNFKHLSEPRGAGGHELWMGRKTSDLTPEEQRAMFAKLAEKGALPKKPRDAKGRGQRRAQKPTR